MAKDVDRSAEGARTRPMALGYVEQASLEERSGWYDEAREVWVVLGEEGAVPLVEASGVTLGDTVTKVRSDPGDPSRPRRGAGQVTDGDTGTKSHRAALGETETRVRAETTDQGGPRRRGGEPSDNNPFSGTQRAALGDTRTGARRDPGDPPSPRRSGSRR